MTYLNLVVKVGGLDRVHDGGAVIACHPHAAIFHFAIQAAAPAVLLEEGVEGGEQVGHGARVQQARWCEDGGRSESEGDP